MATQDHTSFHGGSNAANQDPEYLKRKFRQYLRLSQKLRSRISYAHFKSTRTDGAEQIGWAFNAKQSIDRMEIIDRYIQRLTAPAGGAE